MNRADDMLNALEERGVAAERLAKLKAPAGLGNRRGATRQVSKRSAGERQQVRCALAAWFFLRQAGVARTLRSAATAPGVASRSH
jgi:hypothetical protein